MPELVTIPISFVEYFADFERPMLALWLDRARVVESIFDSLKPWGLDVDNTEVITTGKPSEQGINFKLPEKRAAFFFGTKGCKFTKDGADWASAAETIRILDAARSALLSASKAAFSTQKISLSMHLQPKAKSFLDILKPFISPPLAALRDDNVMTAATIVKWKKSKVILDGSASIANALFVRLEREFDGAMSLEDIANELKNDEDSLFKLIDVQEDLA